ncbi:hypothetical protein B9Z55_009437 [Caenorhabditis nigoni]|nr:hypothetical protein B9Z55_009437 [Caenorhabditis nigoni]
MAKDIYKTFKRSVSGIVGGSGEGSSAQSTSGNNAKYRGGTGRTWIHPPDFLINGHVEYGARFLGCVETAKENGTAVAREAIHAIRFQRDLKRSEQTRETAKLQKVEIKISIDYVRVDDAKTKTMMYQFQLPRISFCADDKDDKRMFSFIARGDDGKHFCYAFTSEKLAEAITCTIGEAFDLAYKRFLDKNRASLENEKNTYLLQKRIAELECENQKLATLLQEVQNSSRAAANGRALPNDYSIPPHPSAAPPALPLSPMPQGPPPSVASNIYSMPRHDEGVPTEMAPRLPPISTSSNGTPSSTSPASTSPSGPAPSMPPPRPPASMTPPTAIAPPPPVAPRRNFVSPKNSTAGQLEGLDLGEVKKTPSNVFDDSFDPRAGEKKSVAEEEYNPFGADFLPSLTNGKTTPPSATAALLASEAISRLPGGESKKTPAELDAMIHEIDRRLDAMKNGTFEFGQLQTGDLDGIEAENAYGTPSDRLNPKVMNLKE